MRKKISKKIKGFSIQFMPYYEIKNLESAERIKKILDVVLKNNILILQGKLKTEEETGLIGGSMAMIGHVKEFKGIELATISSGESRSTLDKFKYKIVTALNGTDLGTITIIGPANIVKEIKRNPKKIELLLNK